MEIIEKKSLSIAIINWIFLIALNLALMSIIGYLTLDSNANMNSRVGAVLLSFFIPIFIVMLTQKMSRIERILKFGLGFIAYIIIALIVVKFSETIVTGLIPSLFISLGILFYGRDILKKIE